MRPSVQAGRSRAARGGLFVLLLALAGCQNSLPPRIGEEPQHLDAASEDAYHAVLDKYSAHKEVYATFDTVMFVALTYQSPQFREARTRRLAAFQQWPPQLLEQKLGEEKAASESGYEFFMGVHMNNRHDEDFDRKNSIWRIALITPSGEVTPEKIERLGRATLDQRAMYPYMGDFWVGYWLRFPKTMGDGTPTVPPGTSTFTVRIASTVGKAELIFPAQ